MGLGFTSSISSLDSYSLSSNPANLINSNSSITGFTQTRIIRTSERRSFVMKDNFGEFLTNADYVANKNSITTFSGGISVNKNIGKNIISIGLEYIPLYTFNSKYREEVRGIESCDECTKDPLIGYHNFNSEGLLDGISIGLAGQYSSNITNIKLGISITKTNTASVKFDIFTDTLSNELINLSPIQNANISNTFDPRTISNFGFVIESKYGFILSYYHRSQVKFGSTNNYIGGIFNEENGLLEYVTICKDYFCIDPTNIIELNYTNVPFVIPQKMGFGLNYSPKGLQQTKLFFEIDLVEYIGPILISRLDSGLVLNDDIISNIDLSSAKSYKFGVEYNLLNETSIRAGLVYKESSIPEINSESIITCGYSKKINNLRYDFGFSINQNEYYYPDVFHVENDPRPNYDKVKESFMNISLAIQYNFK